MSGDDYNSGFIDQCNAYKSALEDLDKGEAGKHFWTNMEYLFGEDSYTWDIDTAREKLEEFQAVWGDDSSNGLGMLERAFEAQKNGDFEGLNTSIEQLQDGNFEFDLDPSEVEAVADALGLSSESFLNAYKAMQMYSDFRNYDLDKLNEALEQVGYSVEDSEGNTVLSMQTLQSELQKMGYTGRESYQVIQDIMAMEGVKILDFNVENQDDVENIIGQLQQLGMIEIDPDTDSIDLSELTKNLVEELGMTKEEITPLLEGIFDFSQYKVKNIEGNTLSKEESINYVQTIECDESKSQFTDLKKDCEEVKQTVDNLQGSMNNVNNTNMSPASDAISQIGTAAQNSAAQIDSLYSKFRNPPPLNLQLATSYEKYLNPPKENSKNSGQPFKPIPIGPAKSNGTYQSSYSTGGVPKDEIALINEIGSEIIVEPQTGKWELVSGGAQFRKLKKGSIVFNAKQSKELLSKGSISTFGKSYADGTLLTTSIPASSYQNWSEKNTGSDLSDTVDATKKLENSSEKISKSTEKTTQNVKKITEDLKEGTKSINWIDRVFETLDNQRSAAEFTLESDDTSYLGQNSRASALATLLELDRIALEKYEKAVTYYNDQYNELSAQVSDDIKTKIENGDIDVKDYPTEEAEQIQKVMDAYDELQKYKADQRSQQKQYAEDQKKYYENELEYLDSQSEILENRNGLIKAQIGYLEETGQIVDASSYEMIIGNLKRQEALAKQKLAKLKAQMAQKLQEDPEFEGSEGYFALLELILASEEATYDAETQQEEYNNKLRQLPIENLKTVIDMYNGITDAMESWGAEIEASGRKLDAGYYQALIDNGLTIIGQLKEEAELVRDVMGEYEVGSEKWQDLYNQLQDINGQMSSMVKNLHEWNEALLQMPLTAINDQISQLKMAYEGMQDLQSDYETVIDAVTNAIDRQKDALSEEKEAAGKEYQSRIDEMQERLDLMSKQNEALKLQTAYEQALYELQSNTQKTEKVIRNGQLVYEKNADQLKNAQEGVQNALDSLKEYEIQKEIDGLSEELEEINSQYDQQIEKLEKIAETWSQIKSNSEEARDAALADQYLGSGWADKILGGQGDDLYLAFKSNYDTNAGLLEQYDKQIRSTENIQALLESYIASYREGTLTYEQTMLGIQGILSQMNSDMSSGQNLQNILDYLAQTNGTNATVSDVLKSVQDALKVSAEEMVKSLKEYNDNLELITDYMTSWEELTTNVSEIRDLIEDVRDRLDDAVDAIRQSRSHDNDDDDDDNDSSSGPGYDDDDEIELINDLDDQPGKREVRTYILGGPPPSDSGPGVRTIKPEFRRDGIQKGLTGSASSQDGDAIQFLATRQLRPDEVPALLHRGEAVLNPEQQATLLGNIQNPYTPFPSLRCDLSSLATQRPYSIDFSMRDMLFKDVRDVDGFAKAMGSQFKLLLRQELGRM